MQFIQIDYWTKILFFFKLSTESEESDAVKDFMYTKTFQDTLNVSKKNPTQNRDFVDIEINKHLHCVERDYQWNF